MATTYPHQQGLDLISGHTAPSTLLPEGYKESFDKSWYEEYIQYRDNVKPNLDTHQASDEWASDRCVARITSSRQLVDIAQEASADGTKCGGSLIEIANTLVCIGAGVSLQDLVVDGFSNDGPGAEHGRLTPALAELDLIIEQDKVRTHQGELDQDPLDQQLQEQVARYQQGRDQYEREQHERRLSEPGRHNQRQYQRRQSDPGLYERNSQRAGERRRDSEARNQEPAAEERANVVKEYVHVKGRQRGLPLLLKAHGGLQEVMTCYDTGTHENHMSRAKAIELGYTIDLSSDMEAGFQLPNGKIIKAVGHVVVAVQFARQVGPEAASMTCRFNVFERLALPVLIGMTFLQVTETITRYTSRMVDLPTTWKRSIRVYGVGNATNQVACTIDGRAVSAAADTGSEIALVSGEYAMKHGLLREYSCEELELADGSLEYTSGFADMTVLVSKKEAVPWSWKAREVWKEKRVRFHVLENLKFDVILDEETIDDLSIFEDGLANFVAAASSLVPSLSPIIHLRSMEVSLTQASDALSKKATSMRRSSTWINSWFGASKAARSRSTPEVRRSPPGAMSHARADKIPRLIIELDQAENRRLDRIERRGALAADDIDKQRYTDERKKLLLELQKLNSTPAP